VHSEALEGHLPLTALDRSLRRRRSEGDRLSGHQLNLIRGSR